MKRLVVIEGPTASGKTSLSVALAHQLNTCILSADSRQFYKELSIGTAKPSVEEQDGIQHYFIDSHSLTDEVTSANFEQEALAVLEKEFEQHNTIVLTGGSGMFIDALCVGLDDIPTSDEIRDEVQKAYETHGLEPLLEELHQKDPVYFEQVDQQNAMRVLRAIEVIRLTGQRFSDLRKSAPVERPFEVTYFVIDHPREQLYNRINQRVDTMMEQGLLEEAMQVVHYRDLKSLNTVGYKELFAYLDGETTLEEAIEKIKQNTRRYAKRQLTWFRRHKDAHWIPFSTNAEMVEEISAILKSKSLTHK